MNSSTDQLYDAWAARYDLDNQGDNTADVLHFEEPILKRFIYNLPAGRALDVGCGTGRWSQVLCGSGWSVIGVDSSPSMITAARSKITSCRFSTILGDIETVELDRGNFDLILASFVFCHIQSLDGVVARLSLALAIGGTFIVSDVHPKLQRPGKSILVGREKYPFPLNHPTLSHYETCFNMHGLAAVHSDTLLGIVNGSVDEVGFYWILAKRRR